MIKNNSLSPLCIMIFTHKNAYRTEICNIPHVLLRYRTWRLRYPVLLAMVEFSQPYAFRHGIFFRTFGCTFFFLLLFSSFFFFLLLFSQPYAFRHGIFFRTFGCTLTRFKRVKQRGGKRSYVPSYYKISYASTP